MPKSVEGALSRERLLAILDELWDGWNDFLYRDGGQLSRPRDAEHPMTAAIVMALASQVSELSRAVATLARADMGDLTMLPLVRTSYETAITAHWLAQVPDATNAFINEDSRSRKALSLHLPNAQSETFRESVESIRRRIVAAQPTSSGTPARQFSAMCDDLELAGVDAYIYYRCACALVHPSVLVADQFLEIDEKDLVVNGASKPMGDAWIFLATASVVWAQMAANYCDPARTRRNTLRRIGRELGISPVLTISGAASRRLAAEKVNNRSAAANRS